MKYYGNIGFASTVEDPANSGIWKEVITERQYFGDILKCGRRIMASNKVNYDVEYSNQISIVSDPFALQNFSTIRYATFMNSKWVVTNVEIEYPRLILTLGGLYNGS